MAFIDPGTFSLQEGKMTCADSSVRLRHGLDVSSHQGEVNWKAVKNDGMEFVILRAAFRGYGTGSLNRDSRFEENAAGAAEAGLQIGAYVFSQAISEAEAEEEAELLLRSVEGKEITGPLVFDWEAITHDNARTDGLEHAMLTACAKAFCNRILAAGRQPMIYFNGYEDYCRYDMEQLSDYGIWFAQYQPQPVFYCPFRLWQYSSTGQVAGISGNVDLDVWIERSTMSMTEMAIQM